MSGFDACGLRSDVNSRPKAGIAIAQVSRFLVQQSQANARDIS